MDNLLRKYARITVPNLPLRWPQRYGYLAVAVAVAVAIAARDLSGTDIATVCCTS